MTDDLTEIDGVGPAIAEQLHEAGFETVDDVKQASVDELANVHMLGESSATAILEGNDSARGRPGSVTEDDHDALLGAARQGKSKRGCARAAGVGKDALDRYLESEPEFRDSFERARAEGESRLIEGGLYDPDVDSSMAKFMLSTSFDYVKTERREHTGEGGGPVEVNFSEEVVETPWGEDQ